MKKFNLILGIIAMICFAFGFSACEKDADFQKQENTLESIQSAADDFSVEIYKLEDGDTLPSRLNFNFSATTFGSYPKLNDTDLNSDEFTPGTYAVRIKRNLLSPTTLSISVFARNDGNNYSATTWAYILDEDDSLISFTGAQVFDYAQPGYLDNLTITGKQSIVLFLTITTTDYYIYDYHT